MGVRRLTSQEIHIMPKATVRNLRHLICATALLVVATAAEGDRL
jgi:hypothetical protein